MRQLLSPIVTRKLGHYVYLFLDPRDGQIFYVGKGRSNRVLESLYRNDSSSVAKRVAAIRRAGQEPIVEILTHNLPTERVALHVEQAVIDVLGLTRLDNRVRGHGSKDFGRATLADVAGRYEASKVTISHKAMLIRINQLYRYGMSAVELYDATRGVWKVGSRRDDARLAFAVYHGIVKEVYVIAKWFPAGTTFSSREESGLMDTDRWEFVGRVASAGIRRKYLNKSVTHHLKPGLQSPIVYINC